MKGSKIALIVLLGFIIAISGVTVVGFALSDSDDSKAKKADETAMSASITTNRPRSVMLSGVNGITVDKLEPHKVVLSWSALNGATGYNVFALDTDVDTEYKLIANTNKPTAELNDLADTTKYRFRITAYIQKNGTLYECPATEYELFTPIGEAEDIKIERSSEVLAFSWKQNDKVSGYDIQRASDDNNNEFQQYANLKGSASEFADEDVENGKLYTYKILPYRVVNNERLYSANGKTVELVSGLGAPADFIARSGSNRVTLNWREKQLASGYNIYMAKGKKGTYELIGTADNGSFTTDKLTAGETYYFRVQPYINLKGGKTVAGTWSTLNIVAADDDESTRSAPKSQIKGSGTYVEISIAQQHMWFYENGKLILDTDVVTGNTDGECDTPTGNFTMTTRGQNVTLTGPGYSSFVNYWMGFYGGCGIHDASWRSSFGGDIYQGNGSHGCVNTPLDKVQVIYERTDFGTPVYVY